MADYAEQFADKQIELYAKQIKKTYEQAAKEVKQKLESFNNAYKEEDAKKRKKVESGAISQQKYQQWLKEQVFYKKQWEQKVKDITNVYVNADDKARELLGGTTKNVFVESANYTAYSITKDLNGAISFNIYDQKTVERLLKDNPKMLPEWKIDKPKDYDWNEKRVRNSVTQGIIQGESIENISKRLTGGLATSNANKMSLFARTAVTGAQNAGRMERLHETENMGIEVKKKWLATNDSRTRDAHGKLDGQEQAIDDPFVVYGMKIMYPGDPNCNHPELVYNCRCTLIYVYPKYEPKEETHHFESYTEWKERTQSQTNHNKKSR